MTTYSDTFNKADNTVVGATLTFTDVVGDIQNVSNRAEVTVAATTARSRAEHDTTSSNQFAEVVVSMTTPASSSSTTGGCLRYDSAADTCYLLRNNRSSAGVDTLSLNKVVTGTVTQLASATITLASGDTLRLEVAGSSLTGYQNGTSRITNTDTSITTGTRGGIEVRAGTSATRTTTYIDNFTFGDLAVPASLIPDNRLVRRNSLLRR